MKKIIICGIAATLCTSALTTSAFATDIAEDTSIFAENPKELVATIKGWPEDNTFLDSETIMPVYSADINDYVNIGKMKITDTNALGKHSYISDLIDGSGNALGVAFISESDNGELECGQILREYGTRPDTYEKYKQCSSVDFRLYSDEIKSLLLANNISTDVKEVKFLDIVGVGTVYYINNGTEEVLVGTKGVSTDPRPGYFEKYDASNIIVLNEEFRQKAARAVEEERKAYENFKDTYGEDAYGAGGNGANPNTGSDINKDTTVLAVELGLITAMIIGGTIVSKKRKNEC